MDITTKKSTPLVSILIPCFDREDFILETLTSIGNQTFKNFECIIVDDGSKDSTVSIIQDFVKKDNRFKLLQREREPKGANTCRNIGYEHSVGDYIVWFDSDDIMLPNYLELQLESISKENFDLSICYLEQFDSDTGEISEFYTKGWDVKDPDGFTKGYVKYIWGVVTNSFFWRRKFIEKNSHLYDESLVHADEFEFIARVLCKNKFTFNSVDQVLFRYRKHANNYAALLSGNKRKILSHLKSTGLIVKALVESELLDSELRRHFLSNVVYYMHEYRMPEILPYLDDLLEELGYSTKKRKQLVALLKQVYLDNISNVSPHEMSLFINSNPSLMAISLFPKMSRFWRLKRRVMKKFGGA